MTESSVLLRQVQLPVRRRVARPPQGIWTCKHELGQQGELTCAAGGADTFRVSTSREGSCSGTTSSRLSPMRMATTLTAIGSPLPICMHRL